MQDAADVGQGGVLGAQAAAVAVAVDLDLRRYREAGAAGGLGDGLGLRPAVEQDAQAHAAPQEGEDARELVRGDADGVGEVGVAAVGEGLGLGEGGDGDRAGCPARVPQEGGDVEALGRLDVRAQDDAEPFRAPGEAFGIAKHPVHVDDREGGVGFGEGEGAGGCGVGAGGGGGGVHGEDVRSLHFV